MFVVEAREHLAAATSELVRLEDGARAGKGAAPDVDELFRHVHSIKGMAASLELDGIATLAHGAEDLVGAFRGARRPDAASIDVLLATADAINGMLDAVRAGRAPEADPVLLERLAAAAAPSGPATVRDVAVAVEIAASCLVPAVRAFLVLKRLERWAEVRSSRPPLAGIRAGQMTGTRLELTLATAAPLAEIAATLGQISDLERVRVTEERAAADSIRPERNDDSVRPGRSEAESRNEHRSPAPPDPSRTVRVRADLLDTFLDSVGELIVGTARLREIGRGLPEEHRPALDEEVDRLRQTVQELHDQVMSVRMTPLAVVTGRLPRAVRDVARRTGKQVELEIRGAEIEIDRSILDELSDPLMHVLRNAVGHGIEKPEERRRSGKREAGQVTVAARRDRDRVVLEISDDGRGMDPVRLREAAVARGAMGAAEAEALDDEQALMLACLPGVSTAGALTDVSGRGVGMDAVKRTVEALGGAVGVESVPTQGTRWTFRVPLTVAVQPVLLVGVGGEVLGLPVAKVHGAVQVADSNREVVFEGEPVPLRDLGELLGFERAAASALSSIVIAEEQGTRVGLVVDALLGQQDLVLKPLLRPFDHVPGLSAVTVLASGRPLFVLDVLGLAA